MEFNDIIGQESIKKSLMSALKKNNISHAYIFNGESGLGKRTMANIFSKKILCENKEVNKCECKSCLLFENGTNPDFFALKPDGSSISVEQIRDMNKDVIVKPLYNKKKVFVIHDAEKMTIQAQNALLKTLEEPPEYVVIILITNNLNMLLETIQSRAIKYNFKKNSNAQIKSYIKKMYGDDVENIDFLVTYSNGKIGSVDDIIKSDEIIEIREKIINCVINLKKMKRTEIIEISDFFIENKDNIEGILNIMMMLYRDLLILKETDDVVLLTNIDKKDILISKKNEFSCNELIKNIDVVTQSIEYAKRNTNFTLLIEVMLQRLQGE